MIKLLFNSIYSRGISDLLSGSEKNILRRTLTLYFEIPKIQ